MIGWSQKPELDLLENDVETVSRFDEANVLDNVVMLQALLAQRAPV